MVIPRPEDVEGDVEGAKNARIEGEKDEYQYIRHVNASINENVRFLLIKMHVFLLCKLEFL
jgi:hypothetical protein